MKIGIDIGGSHIGVGLVQNGKIIDKRQKDITLKNEKNKEELLIEIIVEYILYLLKINNVTISEIENFGIGAPGSIKNGMIQYAPNLALERFEICKEIGKHINLQIKLKNDAKCAALGEKLYGAMKGYDDAVFICLGTGLGRSCFFKWKVIRA